jgi:hypothetical protein
MAVLATGLSVACVYTRYHHVVDVLAGFSVALVGAAVGHVLTRGVDDTADGAAQDVLCRES